MNSTYFHKDLAHGRWQTLSLVDQLGNVGSEVERAIRWRNKGNERQATSAMERALELLDLTIADHRWVKSRRLKELIRLREVLCDWFYGENNYHTSDTDWQKYFLSFGIASRRQ